MKQLFGPHGWLGKSMSMKELPSEKGGFKQFGGKLKQRIENLVGSGTMAAQIRTANWNYRQKMSPSSYPQTSTTTGRLPNHLPNPSSWSH